jgi:hypothetical protein
MLCVVYYGNCYSQAAPCRRVSHSYIYMSERGAGRVLCAVVYRAFYSLAAMHAKVEKYIHTPHNPCMYLMYITHLELGPPPFTQAKKLQ